MARRDTGHAVSGGDIIHQIALSHCVSLFDVFLHSRTHGSFFIRWRSWDQSLTKTDDMMESLSAWWGQSCSLSCRAVVGGSLAAALPL